MPVVTVTAPPLPSVEDERRALSELTLAVADALSLLPADVYACTVHSSTGVLGADAVAPWPVVVLHGSRRPAAGLRAALVAARSAVAASWERPADEVWAQWSIAEDPA